MVSQRDGSGKYKATLSGSFARQGVPSVERSNTSDLRFLYEIGVRRMPPIVNLLDTPASRLLASHRHRRFMRFMRATFHHFSNVNRVCIVVIFAMWAAPAPVARIVTPIMSLGCFPVLALSVALMSSELLALLLRQHEFWFFTITNACNWVIAAVLFNDARIIGCVVCFLITQLVILMDANFRTVVTATKSCVLWVPAICVIIFVCATRTVDIDPARFLKIIPPNKIHFTLANSFLNNNITLMIFVMRKTVRRLHILRAEFLEHRILPCSVLRCDLVLQRMRANDAEGRNRYEAYKSVREASGADHDEQYELNVAPSTVDVDASGISRTASFQRRSRRHSDEVRVFAPVASARSSRRSSVRRPSTRTSEAAPQPSHSIMSTSSQRLAVSSIQNRSLGSSPSIAKNVRQRMKIITPTLAFLDLRNTLLPAWTPAKKLNLAISALHFVCGVVGLLLGAFTMYLPATGGDKQDAAVAVNHPTLFVLVPALSLVFTALFFVPFLASCQRNIVRALWRNFDFAFSSFQFTIGCVCLADMLSWDFRCLALLAWVQWFHWILLWDALVPAMRERFHFKKIYGTPVLVGIMLGLLWIVYSLFFSSYDALGDRRIAEIEWGDFKVSIRTSTFLVGRLNTILTWSVRLVWKALRSEEDELIFLRGTLEYHTPLEIFPVDKKQQQQTGHVVPLDWMGGLSTARFQLSERASAEHDESSM